MENKSWIWILAILGVFLVGYFIYDSFISNPNSQENCEETYYIEYGLEPFDREYLKDFVEDWYVDKKAVAPFYWDKLCRDLLDVRLNETLSKSENLWLDTYSYFFDDDTELECKYKIYWGEEGDFYGRSIENGKEFFSTEEILLAQENRPLKYNESLINIEWGDRFDGEFETRLENNNPDYFVVLKLKLNESRMECQYG